MGWEREGTDVQLCRSFRFKKKNGRGLFLEIGVHLWIIFFLSTSGTLFISLTGSEEKSTSKSEKGRFVGEGVTRPYIAIEDWGRRYESPSKVSVTYFL